MNDIYASLPRVFNAAQRFVDQPVLAGDGDRVALLHADRAITYAEVQEQVNRVGNALRGLGVGMEDRVVLHLLDGPEFVYSFWGAIKIGAIPIPTNTLLPPRDVEHVLDDSRARALIVTDALAAPFRAPAAQHITAETVLADSPIRVAA